MALPIRLTAVSVPSQHTQLVAPEERLRRLCTTVLRELDAIVPARPGGDATLARFFDVPQGSRVMRLLERPSQRSRIIRAHVKPGNNGGLKASRKVLAALRAWAESKLTVGWRQQVHYCENTHPE